MGLGSTPDIGLCVGHTVQKVLIRLRRLGPATLFLASISLEPRFLPVVAVGVVSRELLDLVGILAGELPRYDFRRDEVRITAQRLLRLA